MEDQAMHIAPQSIKCEPNGEINKHSFFIPSEASILAILSLALHDVAEGDNVYIYIYNLTLYDVAEDLKGEFALDGHGMVVD
jgi:hypothetical protein